MYLLPHRLTSQRAGITDSALTNHGTLQIECLARHFATNSVHFNSIFASDLTRARHTAEGICRHQPPGEDGALLTPTLTPDLRERDFGSLEGKRPRRSCSSTDSRSRPDGDTSRHVESESSSSMKRRATSFLESHLLPLIFENTRTRDTVAVVSHGILLRVLWSCLVELFDSMNISMTGDISTRHDGSASLLIPSWSNTGYMSLSIHSHPLPPPLPPRLESTSQASSKPRLEQSVTSSATEDRTTPVSDALLNGWSMKILAVNNKEHLSGLRRARGGIGSASHDDRQRRIDHFFQGQTNR